MPSTPTAAQFAARKNAAFKQVLSAAMIFTANQKLQIGQVAPLSTGYNAFKKRTDLAAAVIKNPDAFTEMFAAEVLITDGTKSAETDPNNLITDIDNAWDNVAGVNQNDINL